ncbi:MAG: hypothetical protein OXI46_10930 [Gemmatimonadota bacterium]|nr:hypothetical protein [Gemmatimonadota bacterium]
MHRMSDGRRIVATLARVRRRWQLRIALRGTAIVLGAGAAAFLLSAFALEVLRFGPLAVLLFRIVAWLAIAGLAYWYLVRPLRWRVTDEQVALYLEEHEPSLEATLLAAVDADRAGRHYSPDLVRGVVRAAVQRVAAVEDGRRIERRALYRSGGALAGMMALALVLLMLAPTGVRHGLSALLRPTTSTVEVNPYSVTLSPGDVVIARGSDQLVTAALHGFSAVETTLYLRERQGEPFREVVMLPGETDGSFEVLLLNLTDGTDYFAEAEGTRSPVSRLDVADLPYVDRLRQVLRFPAYTALPDRVVEDGADVAAVEGTTVSLTVHPTLPTGSGRLVVEGKTPIDLVAHEDGSLTAQFTVDGNGFYRIELAAPDGRLVEGSPRYTIDALTDQPPSVRVAEPGRDGNASPIEEVYFEVEALDDYGVAELSLVYAVNGDEPQAVQLFQGSRPPLAEASAGHTVYLEELDLEPGDLVTYWAVARDTKDAVRGSEVSSDIYFLGIRALGNEYRQAEAPAGGGGGSNGTGGAETSLSELQKQVVAATFNLGRDRDRYTDQEFAENVVSVRLSQERVREQVATLVERMSNRGLAGAEEQFRNIAEMLPEAVAEMEAAEGALVEQDVGRALPHEQKALQHLQRAEEAYERYVALRNRGSGGGGGGSPNAEDLADLFELELDKLRNQYETVQRSARQEQSDEVDGVLERLQELAQRQQQAAERRRLEARGGARGTDQQRVLAQQTEEVARQLETLARETRDQRLAQTARELQDIAEQMRRSAAQGASAGAAGASAAAERLADAQRRLERKRQERLGEDALDALERARALVREQREVRREVRNMSDLRGVERADRVSRLHERKDRMLEEVEELREQLLRMGAEAQREGDRDAAQGFAGAADEIEERKIREKIAYSKGIVQQRLQEGFASAFEAEIGMDLDELEHRIADAGEALDDAQPNPVEEALERARDLVRGTETLDRRLRQVVWQDREGQQQGPQGDNGQQDQQAQQGGHGLDPDAQDGAPDDPVDAPLDGTLGGPAGSYNQRPFTPEEIRAYRREFQERLGDARALRDYLESTGVAPDELDPVVEALQALTAGRPYRDLPELARLQNELREGLQRLEFRLRREVEGDGSERAVLQGSDQVPEGFRDLVEEYFRTLSRAAGT